MMIPGHADLAEFVAAHFAPVHWRTRGNRARSGSAVDLTTGQWHISRHVPRYRTAPCRRISHLGLGWGGPRCDSYHCFLASNTSGMQLGAPTYYDGPVPLPGDRVWPCPTVGGSLGNLRAGTAVARDSRLEAAVPCAAVRQLARGSPTMSLASHVDTGHHRMSAPSGDLACALCQCLENHVAYVCPCMFASGCARPPFDPHELSLAAGNVPALIVSFPGPHCKGGKRRYLDES